MEKGQNRNVVMMATYESDIRVNKDIDKETLKKVESGITGLEQDTQVTEAGVKKVADGLESADTGVSEAVTAKVLKEWLVDVPDLIEETRRWYKEKPEWWGIDPDNTLVFYRTTSQVEEIRALKGESGGHHPHGLALGGPMGQDLTKTGETRTEKNPTHNEVTGLQRRVIREIKKKMGILKK